MRGVHSSWLLLLVAVVPLVGLIAATWAKVDTADALRVEVRRTERTAERATDLMRLDGALFDEMTWRSVGGIGDTLGLPAMVMTGVFGSNPVENLAAAVADVDALVDVEGDAFGVKLDEVRTQDLDLGGVLAAYDVLRDEVRSELDGALADLVGTSTTRPSAGELQAAVGLLDVGIRLRGAITDAYFEYFSVVFDIRDAPAVELARLIETRSVYQTSLDRLRAAVEADSTLGAELQAVLDDPALAAFAPAIDELIDRSLADGVPTEGAELSFATVTADLDGLTATYRAAGESRKTTLQLLDRSAEQVVDAAQRLAAGAERDVVRTYAIAGGLSIATLVAVVLVAGFFVGPLRRLRRAVDQLHTGDLDDADVPVGGPVEVKAAGVALRQTAQHFSLATSQARALAMGDLNADVLDHRVDGGLGDALQSAVGRLREALTQQEEFRRRLSHEASHDGLTQIPNRTASMAQLARSLARTKRSGTNLAVLFVDLDHFKDVNDLYGHQAGDVVLTTVAHRLVNNVREGDFVGRLGGDEFIVVAEPVHDIDDAVKLSQRLLDALAVPIEFANGSATVWASIGVALADATHLTADELLRDADLAVYRAKEVGRGGVEVCDEDLRLHVAETVDLTHALTRAIDQDELVVHYQPIVGSSRDDVRAFEALVRWQRADIGELIPPAMFIEFAERSALIVDVDRWVIDAVARQIADWQDDPRFADVPVAVNVSGRHLLHDDIVAHVLEPLERHGVDPCLLIIELTESALLDDVATAAVKLQRLRDAGVRIAIDDFGTGYTSLAHLRSLPVDILKIDRSFTASATADPGQASIVKLIVDAGHLLGATITAEGIETAAEAERLTGLGSDSLQGYYFARPSPPELLFGSAGSGQVGSGEVAVDRCRSGG